MRKHAKQKDEHRMFLEPFTTKLGNNIFLWGCNACDALTREDEGCEWRVRMEEEEGRKGG